MSSTYNRARRWPTPDAAADYYARVMIEEPKPDPVPADEPPPHPAEPLQITTPVIHLGKNEPTLDDRDLPVFAKEDLSAMTALEEFWKTVRTQLPG